MCIGIPGPAATEAEISLRDMTGILTAGGPQSCSHLLLQTLSTDYSTLCLLVRLVACNIQAVVDPQQDFKRCNLIRTVDRVPRNK